MTNTTITGTTIRTGAVVTGVPQRVALSTSATWAHVDVLAEGIPRALRVNPGDLDGVRVYAFPAATTEAYLQKVAEYDLDGLREHALAELKYRKGHDFEGRFRRWCEVCQQRREHPMHNPWPAPSCS